MQPYPTPQMMGGVPPPPGYYSYPPPQMAPPPAGAYPPQMAPPPQQQPFQQQSIRLARFPGDALHGPPPGTMPPHYAMAPGQQQPGPLLRTGSAGGSGGHHQALSPPAYPPPPMQPFQPMMPGAGMQPRMMAPPQQQPQQMQQMYMGPPQIQQPPSGQQFQPYQQHPLGPPPHMMMQQAMQPSLGPMRSGVATPKSMAGSGANTPMHPMQRALSGAQLLSVAAQPFQSPATFQPPPGIFLPDSLSPGSPGMLRMPGGGGGSASGSRVQSANQLAGSPHARAGSYGGGMGAAGGGMMVLMDPLSPPRAGLTRSGSAGSICGGSLRGSMDLGGSNSGVRRSGERTGAGPGGNLGSTGGYGLSKAPSLAASRAGSAGRRGGGGAASVAAPPELDEYDNIKVAVRVRPPNAQELARGDAQALFVNPSDHRQLQLAVPTGYSRNGAPTTRNFAFHACLNPTSRQQDVLRLCGITQLLDAALDGYNATVMCYGQTGSGKTFTMSGREEALVDEGYMGDSDDGIITRSLMYLFEQLAARSASGDGCAYSLRASYAEIYNEQIYDLIRFDKKQLQVRWDTSKGFFVPDLMCKECGTLEDTLRLLSLAVRHRRVGSHELNMESSRSHSIFTVYVDYTPTRPDDHEYGMTRHGKVSFVDLAGSERLRDSKSVGETLKETTNINRSLFMLGKVIAALADGAQGARVPYRESKLTKLLMDSLGGSSLSLLIACCSPSAAHVEETLSTLSYATRAKNIRNQPVVQVDAEQAALSTLKREIKLLRTENAYLREQLFQANLPRGPPALLASTAGSRLPSSHGQPPGTPGLLLGQPSAAAAGALGAAVGSRPASGGGGGGVTSQPPAGSSGGGGASGAPSPEDLMRRLLETQRMLVQFSKENDRLAGENGRLRTGKTLVANDYKGALEEVDWLRTKLESLETALLSGSLDSGLLAALDGSSGSGALDSSSMGAGGVAAAAAAAAAGPPVSAAEVLAAARAAMLGAGGQAGQNRRSDQSLLQGELVPAGEAAATAAGSVGSAGSAGASPAGSLLSMEPLASMLAAAAQSATVAAGRAVAEAAAATAALAAAEAAAGGPGQGHLVLTPIVPGAAGEYAAGAATEAVSADEGMEGQQQGAVLEQQQQEEQEQQEGVQATKRKVPLIDPYLVANPSELHEAAAAAPAAEALDYIGTSAADGGGSGSGYAGMEQRQQEAREWSLPTQECAAAAVQAAAYLEAAASPPMAAAASGVTATVVVLSSRPVSSLSAKAAGLPAMIEPDSQLVDE